MQRVRKTFFDPLATSKAQIREILEGLPVGSAHPFSPERVLLCRTETNIDEIDISSFPEDFFFNAVDLGEMGETLLRRMAGFHSHLSVFDEFQILQAPASTFKIPIVTDQITILAVSERTPTFYDFCFADASYNACCWLARDTFTGINHSGDIFNGNDLLDYVKINQDSLTEKEICVFISGYQSTRITRFLGTNPALLVANHVDKVLYIIPVPLDAATIGDATICCPLVIKRDGDSLICSILPTATTDQNMMCHSNRLQSPSFPEAIKRADFNIIASLLTIPQDATPKDGLAEENIRSNSDVLQKILGKQNAVFTTNSTAFPSFLDMKNTQIINFSTGIEFLLPDEELSTKSQPSAVVLPCIFGSQLQGPILLATGTVPSNIPFPDENTLQGYYEQLKNIVVIVDDRMTDNARNLATSYRMNALFIVQLSSKDQPKNTDDVLSLLNSANINAVTALAGPQSLVLVQISNKYYFYKGIANRTYLNTSGLAFGSDVTAILKSVGKGSMMDPRVKRMVNLSDANTIILPTSGQLIQPQDLQKLFEELSVDRIHDLEEDISAAIPQLRVLLNQKDLQELSKALVSILSAKVNDVTAPLRNAYIKFLNNEYQMADPASMKKKNNMLGHLRKKTKEIQKALESAISNLANMMSSQTTSKRTHDLKRLVRQAQIQGNIEAVKTMTFETLAGYLETRAEDMGVMLLNIETTPYRQLLGNLKGGKIDARVLHLEGFDAGIIIEQSQNDHSGPLKSQDGSTRPILALPYLNQGRGTGSMLAWVCWDEFVDLKSPYTVRWMEKCNEPHIAALRIIMRDTLSRAVASREHNIVSGSPETGHLMSALLMAAMSKLAAMRTSTPVLLDKAEDTVTRLMRGLFGNLLTIAGSGVRPSSMVWQLFGLNSQYDIPKTDLEWIWYETVVALYPYTGWPLKQFYENLEKLLDKTIIRVVTKNENPAEVRLGRTATMVKQSKLKNIQLSHSRTIITILMRMLSTVEYDIAAVAARLLKQVPLKLEGQTESYGNMIQYLEHLAKGGQRRGNDDLVAANVYNNRSAVFGELKARVSEACKSDDWDKIKQACQALMDKHVEIAALFHVNPESLKMQNTKAYKDLLNADIGADIDQDTKTKNYKLTRKVLSDAEIKRVPWRVGKEGEFGETIEPLDEAILKEILNGGIPEPTTSIGAGDEESPAMTPPTTIAKKPEAVEFAQFKASLPADFINTIQNPNLSAEDVCGIMKVPVSTMRVFIKALNPDFVWEDLGDNFKKVMLGLLKDRSGRVESRPVWKLLELQGKNDGLLIEE